MNETEIEALALAITENLLTSPAGLRAEYLTHFRQGILRTMSEADLQQRIAKVIRGWFGEETVGQ
jgi:hypothetical protein